jgi:hypothetical protein
VITSLCQLKKKHKKLLAVGSDSAAHSVIKILKSDVITIIDFKVKKTSTRHCEVVSIYMLPILTYQLMVSNITAPTINKEQFTLIPELFGPGYFVGLGLRLKSEIRTRTRART